MPDHPDENQPFVPPPPASVPPPSPPPPSPPPAAAAPAAAPPPPPAGDTPPPPAASAPAGGVFSAPAGLPASVAYGQGKLSVSDDRTFCVLSHALGAVVGFLAPLIFWLIKKDESPAVDAHGKEALNFQLNIVGWYILSIILMFATCGFLFFLPWLVWLYSVVLSVLAAFKASEGQLYRYPLTWRLIK